jgi:Thioredoxin
MASSYDNESFTQTLIHFFPGIIKTFAVLAIIINIGIIGNALVDFSTSSASGYVFEPKLVRDANFKLGKTDSRVKFIYFVDFQCSACKANNEPFKLIKDEYKDRVLFVYKHNPLTTLHPNAKQAAIAVQAAGKQGKYLEYAEQAFANQNALGSENLTKYATNVGLDLPKWQSAQTDKDVLNAVEFDQKDLSESVFPESTVETSNKTKPAGQGAGTPTIVLTLDDKIVNWWTGGKDPSVVKAAIDKQLAQ